MPGSPTVLVDGPYSAPAQNWKVRIDLHGRLLFLGVMAPCSIAGSDPRPQQPCAQRGACPLYQLHIVCSTEAGMRTCLLLR